MVSWYWEVVMAVVTFNVAFVMAAVLRTAIRHRIEKRASEGIKQGHAAKDLALDFDLLERPWPTFAPRRESGDSG
jgi:hypothetical protein